VAVLAWNTPLEGMLPQALVVRHGERDLPFDGPTVKRGDPGAEDYVRVPAGGDVAEDVDLAEAYTLPAGAYTVRFDGRLHDVAPSRQAPRRRRDHRAVTVACGPVPFVVRDPR
jgi:hypothetical protein